MRKLSITLSLLLVVSLVMAGFGCAAEEPEEVVPEGPPEGPIVSVDVSYDDFMRQQHFSQEVEVAVDGSLTVTLCSNPTTGFKWSEPAKISDQTVLQQVDHRFVPPPERPEPVFGEAGKEVWTFHAEEKGKSTIFMEYSQPWEGGTKAARTFVLTVIVK